MNSIPIQLIGTVIFYLFIFIFGFLVTNAGKPPNTALLTVHKLVSIAALAYLIVYVVKLSKEGLLNPVVITSLVITAIFFVLTIASGGFVSVEKPIHQIFYNIHHVLPYLTALATAVSFTLILR